MELLLIGDPSQVRNQTFKLPTIEGIEAANAMDESNESTNELAETMCNHMIGIFGPMFQNQRSTGLHTSTEADRFTDNITSTAQIESLRADPADNVSPIDPNSTSSANEPTNPINLIKKVTKFIVRKCVSYIDTPILFHASEEPTQIIKLVYRDSQLNFLIRISFTPESLTLLLATFIRDNINSNGIFTELWEQPSIFNFRYLGNPFDRIIEFSLHTEERNPNVIDNLMFDSFENERERVLSDLYDEHKDQTHIINTISPVTLSEERRKELFSDPIKECGLCCEQPKFICAQCKYPICSACLEHIKHSTGICPSCRMKPWLIIEIPESNHEIEVPTNDETIDH